MVKIWLKKLFVLIVAIMTLGFYVPPINLEVTADSDNKKIESEKKSAVDTDILTYEPSIYLEELKDYQIPVLDPTEEEELIDKAKDRTIEKLGPKIYSRLDQEITEEVIPNIEAVITNLIELNDSEEKFNLAIIENKVPGYGERIFDLYDEETDQIIAKFHVRRENRPLEGYWFNFHYHLASDQFEKHYVIAELFWSKDTPPKWMS